MKRLVSTVDLSHKEWLAYRKRGLTGTDAGSIVGLNPYRSAFAVYQDKISDDIEQIDNEAMRQGRDLEEYVARRFAEETGMKVRRANAIFQNEDHPIMLADFDRVIVGQKAGLECKTVSPYSSDKWDEGKIPLHYQMQVQHYLAVSGFDCWYVAALIFGTDFIIHKIERDESMIQDLITIEERFWKENVMSKIPPEPDGSGSYTEMLRKQYFGSRKDNEVQLFGLEEDLRRRDELKELIDRLDTEKTAIEQRVQLQMGMADSCCATCGSYHVSWIPTVQQRIDSKRLKEEQPFLYKQYLKESYSKRFSVKLIKEKKKAA